ncbi:MULTISPECIES: hypothetical protein [Rhodococcus]|uniref:Uncharacterized protein n=1 Tax=Rhodococcus oxybenzonivorans TaxID=1990687 RepID=A0AAE4UZV3_9NOCA|nr:MULTISPECIES: hypothetical protein [Rhodococcus]MDV7241842.1 hypothetical protein [Rhodococcus oxybenzonivorans]MDV7265504.1 hypothetical protein [Rhodococcus oxybenzonivorans]MDV7273624.1 hypothetical protein [Rhodococcus oxybenzonivorans]MDV7334124.1 hypothetical protein [Rhodococcus oxybenzonivorans]MDV7343543.1 hypothetical protein [Rhodococcus oxybenzonivorans]
MNTVIIAASNDCSESPAGSARAATTVQSTDHRGLPGLDQIAFVRQFQTRNNLEEVEMVIAADAGMVSATNLKDLDAAGLKSSSDPG